VAETDILKLKPGQEVALSFVGVAQPVAGKVRLVEPQLDAQSRLGRVRIWIDDSSAVRSGMFADATILAERKEALVIPVSAASSAGGRQIAMRVTDGVVSRVEIVTGIRDGGLIEVVAGLAEGDTVVAKAGAFVRDGDRINPVPADAEQASN
jgi:HlyD family secretion protein